METKRFADRLDHLIYATPHLDSGVDELEKLLGVRAIPGGQHPGLGTRNALIALGPECYLEIIGPDPEQPPPERPRVFGIDQLTASRLVRWAAKERDLESRVEAMKKQGFQIGEILWISRRKPDGSVLSGRITDPYVDCGGGVVPFLIEWGKTPSPARTAAKGCTLRGLRAEHPDAAGTRAILQSMELDLPVKSGPVPALIAMIDTPRGPAELR